MNKYWYVLLLCYVFLLLLNARYFYLFFTAKHDLRRHRIKKAHITVSNVFDERYLNFYSHGVGASVGRQHCLIKDTCDNKYRISAAKAGCDEMLTIRYSMAELEIEYLEKSLIVINVRENLTSKDIKAKTATENFKKSFSENFANEKDFFTCAN